MLKLKPVSKLGIIKSITGIQVMEQKKTRPSLYTVYSDVFSDWILVSFVVIFPDEISLWFQY